MRKHLIRLFSSVCAVMTSVSIAACAQSTAPKGETRPEVAFGYNYLRSNAPAGDCGCFGLNGGNLSVAIPTGHAHLSIVGDVAAAHASAVANTGLDLTLSTYTVGMRYAFPPLRARLRPFGEALVGIAHSSGSLVDSSRTPESNAGAAFASLVGGGLDTRVTPRLSIRLIEANYLVTTFDNGSNDHQNNLRISSGIVVHF